MPSRRWDDIEREIPPLGASASTRNWIEMSKDAIEAFDIARDRDGMEGNEHHLADACYALGMAVKALAVAVDRLTQQVENGAPTR